jgi:transcriptional regulator with XRE-family HTH domain
MIVSTADLLARLLADRGWKPADLSRKSTVTHTAIANYLAGRPPKYDAAVKLADALEVNVDYLLNPARYTQPLSDYVKDMDAAKTQEQRAAAMEKLRLRTTGLAEASALHDELARERAKVARLKKLLQQALAEL